MYAVVSDIHGNLPALEAVNEDMKQFNIDGIFCLGDLIDYGMQSNETVEFVKNNWEGKMVCNLWGNHENAIMTSDYNHFSSERGVKSAQYTASILSGNSREYIHQRMIWEGMVEMMEENNAILAVHASLENVFWKAIGPENVRGDYRNYDIVLSGHSHYSHVFSKFYEAEDPERRNKHAVLFVNPGSVGQPRNHNPHAQYALLDLETKAVILRAVPYEIEKAMSLYDGSVDEFYKNRLKYGV